MFVDNKTRIEAQVTHNIHLTPNLPKFSLWIFSEIKMNKSFKQNEWMETTTKRNETWTLKLLTESYQRLWWTGSLFNGFFFLKEKWWFFFGLCALFWFLRSVNFPWKWFNLILCLDGRKIKKIFFIKKINVRIRWNVNNLFGNQLEIFLFGKWFEFFPRFEKKTRIFFAFKRMVRWIYVGGKLNDSGCFQAFYVQIQKPHRNKFKINLIKKSIWKFITLKYASAAESGF